MFFIRLRTSLLLLAEIALLVNIPVFSFAQHKIPSGFCITKEELKLADAINKIRKENDKKTLPLSASLSYVANLHANDLNVNHPDTSICNLSSWSDKGKWTSCCFNAYVVDRECMWKKPKQLTNYRYRGYELAGYMQEGLRVDSLIDFWKSSPEAMDMILTNGLWKKKSWACFGVGIRGNYVTVWFGQRPDRAGKPKICNKKHQKKKSPARTKNTSHAYYYIIAGSFPNLTDAREALKRLKNNGYKHAGIMANKNRYRIYLNRYKVQSTALKVQKKLPKSFSKTWILKK